MKPPSPWARGKLPLPLSFITIAICAIVFFVVLYTERISLFSSTNTFKSKPSAKRNAAKSNKLSEGNRSAVENTFNTAADVRLEFDPNRCTVMHGKWVFNSSYMPSYTDSSCPHVDRQFSCVKNGRMDSDYRHWEWQPDDCKLPRFNPELALKKIRGKRLMFVGDSLQRGQWQSFVCLIESIIPEDQKFMKRHRIHSVFEAKEYNATVEFYWAPFLVESNTDMPIIDRELRRIKLDSVAKHAKHWAGVDILVFNTYIWWLSGAKHKTLWGSWAYGEKGYEELETPISYRMALRTWANWVDSTVDPNKTRVFFMTMSPTHHRSADWDHENGIKCYNETRPVMRKEFWGTGSDKRLMNVVANVSERMKVPVTFINITQLSDYRIDGHSSIYSELGGHLLTDEQKADPLHFADCIHWCLPGVPDTWNQIFLAYL